MSTRKKIVNTKTKTLKKTLKKINYKNGVFIFPKEFYFENTDSNIMNAAKLLNSSLKEEVVKPKEFLKYFRENMNNFFLKKHPYLKEEYKELNKTNKSNGYRLKWNVIIAEPNHNFDLHIHPNIEFEYSPFLKYSLDEERYKYLVDSSKLTNNSKKDFSFSKSKVVINPVNSMHHSYTKKNYGVLLVLWSGKHIKIPLKKGSLDKHKK
jgi:hypothetical protein